VPDRPAGAPVHGGGPVLPGSAYAAQIRQFDAESLRERYPGGVVVDPRGFPQWDLLGRAAVQLPDPEPGLTVDEIRLLDVLTANEVMVLAADPLWAFTADDYAALTPPGWVWAHLPAERRAVLVPVEAYAAFRHTGGVALLVVDRSRRGVTVDDAMPVPMDVSGRLGPAVLARVEGDLGIPLPPSYRDFLARTNGATATTPAVHPRHGFVADQPFFGVHRDDPHQDLRYANRWFGDRLTRDFLAVGYVQGGLIAVRVAGPDTGSVWYWDDDDHRDDDRFDAAYICGHLLHRLADDVDAFWNDLAVPPGRLLELVDDRVGKGRASAVSPPDLGRSLPVARRPPA
jgi:hypothetical protein